MRAARGFPDGLDACEVLSTSNRVAHAGSRLSFRASRHAGAQSKET
jgi:hypothetical protein